VFRVELPRNATKKQQSPNHQIPLLNDLVLYKEYIFRICFGFCRDTDHAEDLAQEVFLRAFRRKKTLRDKNKLRPWLFKIVKNTYLDSIKMESRKKHSRLNETELPTSCKTPESVLDYREQIKILRLCIGDLPIKIRSVFILREYAGLSYEDIAKTLKIRKGTVMSRLNRAKQKLVKEMRGIFYDQQ